jgi:plasmid stabilization system protein ParE
VALAEAEAALAWYAERSSRAPAAFLEELDKGIKSIQESPKRWPVFDQDCRRFPLFRFPYFIVYYEKSESVIQILAVAHGRRRLGYWRPRRDDDKTTQALTQVSRGD